MEQVTVTMNIMGELLEKKISILKKIKEYTVKQNELINKDDETYFELVNKKQPLVEEIIKIDDAFNGMFGRIKKQVTKEHEPLIKKMQEQVKTITDLDVSIRVSEERNRKASNLQIRKIDIPKIDSKKAVSAYIKHKKR